MALQRQGFFKHTEACYSSISHGFFLEPIEVFNSKTRSKPIDPAALVYCLVSYVVIYALTIEKAKGSAIIFEDILTDVTGVYPKVMIDGDMDVGAWSCGLVAGLLDGIMAQVEILIRARPEGMFFDVKSAAAQG